MLYLPLVLLYKILLLIVLSELPIISFKIYFVIGKDGSGGSDDNESVINDNMSVISNASADSYMKDFEGKLLQISIISTVFKVVDFSIRAPTIQ